MDTLTNRLTNRMTTLPGVKPSDTITNTMTTVTVVKPDEQTSKHTDKQDDNSTWCEAK